MPRAPKAGPAPSPADEVTQPAKKAVPKKAAATKAVGASAAATTADPVAKKAAAPAKAAKAAAPAKAAKATKAAKVVDAPVAPPARPRAPLPELEVSAAAAAAKRVPPRAEATSKKAPAKPQDPKFLDEQRELLLAERAQYDEQARSLKAEADQLAADAEPGDSQFDEEGAEGDSMSVERERDLALAAQARANIDEIDRALAKIGRGTYGYCERCGQAIMKARLQALPFAKECVACKTGGLSARR